MKNAHERFGKLAYLRRTEKTATNIRVLLDAFVGEDGGKAHLVSVVGGDVEVGALAAAFASGDPFTVIDPEGAETIVGSGKSQCVFAAPLRSKAANGRYGTWSDARRNSQIPLQMEGCCW